MSEYERYLWLITAFWCAVLFAVDLRDHNWISAAVDAAVVLANVLFLWLSANEQREGGNG